RITRSTSCGSRNNLLIKTPGAKHLGSLSFNEAIAPDHLRVPPAAVFDNALLGLEIHVHQPEAHAVAIGPLEVIQERPDQVARHRLNERRVAHDRAAVVIDAEEVNRRGDRLQVSRLNDLAGQPAPNPTRQERRVLTFQERVERDAVEEGVAEPYGALVPPARL